MSACLSGGALRRGGRSYIEASVTKLGDPSSHAAVPAEPAMGCRWGRQAALPGGGLPSPGGTSVTWQPSRARVLGGLINEYEQAT
jgi:hypothetical protein